MQELSTAYFKDRKSNAAFGNIFDSGGLSQSPISHQEVLGADIKPPQRTPPALPIVRIGAAGGDFSGYRHESSLTSGGSSCLILFWPLPGPTRRCADRTRSPVRAGLTHPNEDRCQSVPQSLRPPIVVAATPRDDLKQRLSNGRKGQRSGLSEYGVLRIEFSRRYRKVMAPHWPVTLHC
jgi:hypothetical protein